MSIPMRLTDYLKQRGVDYEICAHKLSRTSAETARAAHIPRNQLAKSVVLEDDTGYIVAVVPADQSVRVGKLMRMLGRHNLHLADESAVAAQFVDCDTGAVPSLAMPWGIETIVDDALAANETVYLESGDHERLLKITHDQFLNLIRAQRRGDFCKPQQH